MDNIDNEIVRLHKTGLSQVEIASRLGISRWRVRRSIYEYRKSENNGISVEPNPDGSLVIESPSSSRIRTVDDLLEEAGVDLDIWEIERQKVNKYETAAKDNSGNLVVQELIQITAWLRKRPDAVYLKHLHEELIDLITKYAPVVESKHKTSRHGLVFEIAVYDIHLGKLAWGEETGQDYDINIAKKLYLWSIEQHLNKIKSIPVSKIIFVVGNDLFHFDNQKFTTTSGTVMDTDTRWLKVIRTGFEVVSKAADMLSEVAPVDLIVIPGNHDRHSSLALGEMLRAWFSSNENISVDNSPKLRKYRLEGKNLIGFGHGDKEKPQNLIGIMASEAAQYWSKSVFREMHLGHIHSQKISDPLIEKNGIVIRYISSPCATDAWHHEEGFVGNLRSSQSFLWDNDNGLSAIFYANVPPE